LTLRALASNAAADEVIALWRVIGREEEAAQLRTLDRSLRDEALAEQLLSEQASPPLIGS
jgi:hypothetical protein